MHQLSALQVNYREACTQPRVRGVAQKPLKLTHASGRLHPQNQQPDVMALWIVP